MNITFFGAVETVTGSQTLVETTSGTYLVDCGLFQGTESDTKRNRHPFGYDPKKLKAVFLTHSHIDHSGLLPRLVSEGFNGPIYATKATRELCQILLEDSASLQKSETKRWNDKNPKQSRRPLYTQEDVEKTLQLFRSCVFDEDIHLNGITFKFTPAGHILGAASLLLKDQKQSILFSGDYGRKDDILMFPPSPPTTDIDAIIVEGTYGDRLHPDDDVKEILREILKEIIREKSVLVIPAFAVARSQALMCLFYEIFEQDPKLEVPMMMSSPMIEKVTAIYEKFAGEYRLDQKNAKKVFNSPRFLKWKKESENINRRQGPMIIISASGMVTGGRVVHHLKALADDSKNIILISGYQGEETPGRKILDGEKRVYIDGQKIDIQAKIKNLSHLSAHGDRSDLAELIHYYPENVKVFLQHGEQKTLNNFKEYLQGLRPGQDVTVAEHAKTYSL